MTRRELLSRMGGGFGMLGMAGVSSAADPPAPAADPLAPRAPHFAPKAKRVIFLMLNGGLSQVDTFDPKPMLDKYDGKPFPGGNPSTERKTGNLMRSPFHFRSTVRAASSSARSSRTWVSAWTTCAWSVRCTPKFPTTSLRCS